MIEIRCGSIFDINAMAMVNPANISLLQGSGLCGLIHKRAGRELENHCKTLGKRHVGDVVITPSFQLEGVDWIIHACGPRWMGGNKGEADMLRQVYRNLFNACVEAGITSVAIPAIATGIYHFPLQEATEIALQQAIKYRDNPELRIVFVNADPEKHEIYTKMYAMM
ncbi:MAG: macro domain-containing protein [Candidatus Thiothrix putei]|uniref:Macro domain-containing protein n=1 Tax=Candidatus Thiothrix putei TaxID=3080811 RepID=A0AA95HDY7_9GAMM|nr:MAG: macro domain-containing protein [Candidatus Thiothrix putei]